MATDFFSRQEHARRKTGLLIVYFVMAVLAIIVAVYLVVSLIMGGFTIQLDPVLFAATAAVTLLVIGGGTAYQIAALSGGGHKVAELLGGRLVPTNSADPIERRLLNVVEEMAIASGTPVPPVYLLEDEAAINAFAAGSQPGDAVIGVTRGTVTFLSRDELQGVIGHEFSHILNGDMRLNIRLMGILQGILVIALLGRILMQVRSSDSKNGGGIVLLGVALFLIGWIGVFFGRLIKSAVSRQREYLADASAVQFTRNPLGIANALKKIGTAAEGSKISNVHAEEASHLFFGNGVNSFIALLSTHPPLEKRIKILDPSFDGTYPARLEPNYLVATHPTRPSAATVKVHPTLAANELAIPALASFSPGRALEQVGTIELQQLDHASTMLRDFPIELTTAARDSLQATALIYALLLDSDEAIRDVQTRRIVELAGEPARELAVTLAPSVRALGRGTRIPLVDLALGALKQLTPEQHQLFRQTIHGLIQADERVDLFEFVLHRMLKRHLDRRFNPPPKRRTLHHDLSEVLPECLTLLGRLAWVGGENDAEASARAYQAGIQTLGLPRLDQELPNDDQLPLKELNRALEELALTTPPLRKKILGACAACIGHDQRITIGEYELLRAVADSLDCPMPPVPLID